MNFIIANKFCTPNLEWIVDDLFGNEPLHKLAPSLNKRDSVNMWDILVMAGVFPSKSQARKNWNGPVEIPWGFNQWTVGKQRTVISIWKPIPDSACHASFWKGSVTDHNATVSAPFDEFFFKVRKLST